MPPIPKIVLKTASAARKRLTAVGCHIFAGGFTVGVRQAGFDVLCHLENTEYGVATAKANFPDLPIYVGEDSWPLANLAGKVDFIYCNPPCAPWSMMGPRTTRGSGAWRDDPRLSWWRQAVRLLTSLRPSVWACESVTQIYSTGREFVDEMTLAAMEASYSVTHLLLDAKWAGIPQSRKRFFLLCHRSPSMLGLSFDWREVTVRETLSRVADPGYFRPFRSDLKAALQKTAVGGRLVTTWEQINPGFTHRRNARGHVRGRPSFQDCRLPLDGAMGAYVGDKVYHPTKHRLLGINEAKAVCGYPLDFELVGRQGPELGSLLARAVMPPVGRWLAKAVKATAAAAARTGPATVLLVDLRQPPGSRKDLTPYYARAVTDTTMLPPTATQVKLPDSSVKKQAEVTDSPETVACRLSPATTVACHGGDSPLPREGSGEFIRRLWMTGRYSPEELVAAVHDNWQGRTTKTCDVYYNYRKLLNSGVPDVPPWPSRKKKPLPTAANLDAGQSPGKELIRKKVAFRRRILLTGSTPMQVGSQKTHMKIVTSMMAWQAALTEMGYTVDWRPVSPGEDLTGYAAVIAALNKPVSIASRHFYGTLWSLYNHPAAIATMDDWQTLEFMPGVRTASKTVERAFRIFQHVPKEKRNTLYEELCRLRDERWPWTTVVPVFAGGDISLLGLDRGKIVGFDPTSYVRRYPWVNGRKERRWVQASLLLKDSYATDWPTEFFGNAGRARGGQGKSKEREAQPRLIESELMVKYCQSWGILSPAHPHGGSGWWRVRYLMSADAGCVLSASPEEAAVLGEPYERTAGQAGIAAVEKMTDGMLRRVAADQRRQLESMTWSKEMVKDFMADLLKKARVRR